MPKNRGLSQGVCGIITGASSGIGKALAIELALKYEAHLVINARRKVELEETAKLISANGGVAITCQGDIASQDLSRELVNQCLTSFGRVDLLVNNAGIARPGSMKHLNIDDWRQVFAVNFFAAVYATYAVLPEFLKQGRGKIVNVSSVAGKVSFPGSVCYSASKFALTGMSEGMAAELVRDNIDVITVCPGWVRTEFFENNQHDEKRNPTLIAQRKDLAGWLMRNCLSISSEDAAREIIKACELGGSQEIILTTPGAIFERLAGLSPKLVQSIARAVPPVR